MHPIIESSVKDVKMYRHFCILLTGLWVWFLYNYGMPAAVMEWTVFLAFTAVPVVCWKGYFRLRRKLKELTELVK